MESVEDDKLQPQKMEVDYSSAVDSKIPICEVLAKEGKLQDAIDSLLVLEKQTRTAADMHSTSRLLIAIVRLCFEQKDWQALNDNVVLLTKRRGQLKQAVTKMVQEAFTYVDQTPDMETKLKLIDTLRTVTEGKIYVEIERARLTKLLASIKEGQGNIVEAATILQELQVETFGSMDKKEKVEFILEQMRLCLAKKDYVRTQIISKKISSKFFEEAGTEDLQLKFYRLMIELDEHDGAYVQMCKHYRAIYDIPRIKDNLAERNAVLKCVIMSLILAPYDNEQSDLIHRIKEDKNLEDIPIYRSLLTLFTTAELMQWNVVCQLYEGPLKVGSDACPATNFFNRGTENDSKRWNDFKDRVVEHNIRVMAKYYMRIKIQRMAELLGLTEGETEEFLSKLVVNKTVQAKVDRLSGIVQFASRKDPNEILNEWAENVQVLMKLVNRTTHLITKEEMLYKLH